MNIIKFGMVGAATLTLAACNGSTDTATPTTAPSTVFDLALPADFDRDALPSSAQDALAEFERRNALDIATGGPTPNASGNFTFFGTDTLGIAVAEDDGSFSFVQGDVLLTGNVNSATVSGQFQDLVVIDSDGNVTPQLGEVIRLNSGALINGQFTNALSTDVNFDIDGTSASVTGNSQGAFVGDGSEALGIVDATVTIGANSPQDAFGGWTADQLP